MDRKKLFKTLVYLIIFILIINFFANKFYWYYSIWYFDMIMHFLGGFWIGLAFIYLLSPKNNFVGSTLILKILIFVFLIGVGWEVFEILVNKIIAQNPFNTLDITSDICFDLAGGAFAILFFSRKIMPLKENII